MMKMKLEEQRKSAATTVQDLTESNRVKIRRKSKIVLTEFLLRQQFSQFGKILFMIVSKNGKSAVLEYEQAQSLRALQADCPTNFEAEILSINGSNSPNGQIPPSVDPPSKVNSSNSNVEQSHEDYEDFVFRQLLQAESSKRKVDE